MTVLLVLCTFLVLALVDYGLNYKRSLVPHAILESVPALDNSFVEGFHVPATLSYHAGHTWLVRERRHVARIGVDEFAAKLAGRIDRLELPQPGQWLRQGQKAWNLYRKGEQAAMLSPIEGEVVEVNPEVLRDPSLLAKDPYGAGWLMTVYVADEEDTWRNLLPGTLVRGWMRDAATRLYAMQPSFAGAVAADGGRAADDLLEGLAGADWSKTTAEFFLS